MGQGPDLHATGLGVTSNPGGIGEHAGDKLQLFPWVIARGGEYFFTPSMKTLKEKFSQDAGPPAAGESGGGELK